MLYDLPYHLCKKTQTSSKYEGQTYTTLVFYGTILPKIKDTNTIHNQIIWS